MKEFVVKTANDKEVNNLQHRESRSKDTQCTANSRLCRAARRNESGGTRQILFTFKEASDSVARSLQEIQTESPEAWACLTADRKSTDGMASGVSSSAVYRCWKVRRKEKTSAVVSLEVEVAGGGIELAGAEARPGSCSEHATASRRRRQAASGSIRAAGSAGSRPKTFMMKVSHCKGKSFQGGVA